MQNTVTATPSKDQPELTYFDWSGRAEPIRIALHAAGIPFTDTRVPSEDFQQLKPTLPLGQVPTLKIDDQVHCQSLALARYTAKLGGLYPADPKEALLVDEACDTIYEMTLLPKSKCKKQLVEMMLKFVAKKASLAAKHIEGILQQRKGPFVLGYRMTMADLVLAPFVERVEEGKYDCVDPKFFKPYPAIQRRVQAVREHGKVVAYRSKL